MVYDVNVAPISPKMGIQILDFLSQLGYYKTAEGIDDFECTTRMIDFIAEKVKSEISSLTSFEKVDLGIALMIIPIPPALELANKCLQHISEAGFKSACLDLITLTGNFEKFGNNLFKLIDGSNFAIGIIARYLHPITGKMEKTVNEFQNKFQDITDQISLDMYGKVLQIVEEYRLEELWRNIGCRNIELTTCGEKGRFGPSLESCISTYNSDWSKNKKFFYVSPHRKGIQKIRIYKNGSYKIKAWGAGNYTGTGSGMNFT